MKKKLNIVKRKLEYNIRVHKTNLSSTTFGFQTKKRRNDLKIIHTNAKSSERVTYIAVGSKRDS